MDKLQLTTSGSASPSAEMANRILAASLDRIIEAAPDAADAAMKKAVPDLYTPELASQFAENFINALRRAHAPQPLTAAQRGIEWMLRWGCTPWCINDHTDSASPEWHSAGPVKTDVRTADLDSSGYSEDGGMLPWLSAEVIVTNEKPQAYGRETQVFLGYGVHLAELSPARARVALEAMRGFVADLEAVVDRADEIAKDDFEGDPEIAQAHKEAEARRIKRITEAAA
ncbi:hypothetical protein ACFWDQ_16745 [Streptomyces sp. NPDC060053]|uniref:hypothetical protein n=1 Tax=Streptomyces sp. NPDC060053 TaxID=3347047 RepID=UPI0036CF4EA8